jgi:glutamate N-acetyltransferase / amino-acid N-acetyltransferase
MDLERPDLSAIHLLSPAGFRAGAVRARIKSSRALDVVLLVCDRPASAAAMFTSNKVVAAPIQIARVNVAGGRLRGIVVNSGNANACTGRRGLADARRMCAAAARAIGCTPREILPASTGIIGHHLPMPRLLTGIAAAGRQLGTSAARAAAFADAILTTDTRRKTAGAAINIGRHRALLAGVCKGSGMIGPRLTAARTLQPRHATMLAFLTTDADVPSALLRQLLNEAVQDSFNAVTVDDHASTNDCVVVLASGRSGVQIRPGPSARAFAEALQDVCLSLAKQIAADGEGATRVVRVEVCEARNQADARTIARAIANSPLVKCAMHGCDPNWGRIVSAAGMCDAAFDPDRARLTLQAVTVFAGGQPKRFDAAGLSRRMNAKQVDVVLSCGLGSARAACWTCDLSAEYVRINADYHT